MRSFTKTALGLTTAGLLITGLAACSTDEGSTSTSSSAGSSSSSSAETTPTPVASIPALTGVDTAVLLDADFAAALTSLGLTPGTVGTATLEEGSLHFPITGGNVKYYNPRAPSTRMCRATSNTPAAGCPLTAGSTTRSS